MALKQTKVPGTLYSRNGRWWWKVQMPGEDKLTSRPLKPVGSRWATTDRNVALELAVQLWQSAVYSASLNPNQATVTHLASLAAAYFSYADGYYVHSREASDIRCSIKPLLELFSTLPVEEFGPLRLLEVREQMIQLNWSRKLINQRMGRIKRMFKWAVSRQMISPVVYHGLMTVEGLKRGRSTAREGRRVLPVDPVHVDAVLPFLPAVVADMVQILMLTGMRPGELVIMRPCDIDRSTKIWHYTPVRYKTQYLENPDTPRIISLGPKSQQFLSPYLLRPAETFCFSPAESEKQRRGELTAQRKTPLSCGNRHGTNRVDDPHRIPGDMYDTKAFAKALRRAIQKARKAGVDIPHWTLYQLRHTAATRVRREMGYESAGAALGHVNMSATAIYAERNQGLADEAARRFG